MSNLNTQGGFTRLILLIIIAVLALSYFNIDLKTVAEKPQTKSNVGYVMAIGGQVWHEYLSRPVLYFWNNIFVGILWSAFVNNFELIKRGMPPVNFTPTSENSKTINKVLDDMNGLEPKSI